MVSAAVEATGGGKPAMGVDRWPRVASEWLKKFTAIGRCSLAWRWGSFTTGGSCPRRGPHSGGRRPVWHDGDGSRLGNWAHGHVEEETRCKAVAHGWRCGGTARRW
jgi:hypothetical protein